MPNRPEFTIERDNFNRRLSNKGVWREIRANKRTEAEERNANSAPDNRRAFWRERGFGRKSEARRAVWGTVTEINEQAKIHKQRSEDWPMVGDDLAESSSQAA